MKKITIILLATFLMFAGMLMLVTTVSAVAPVNSVPAPTNTSIERGLNPTLSITINDADGPMMNQTFRTNTSGTWTVIGTNHWEGNGTVTNTTTVFTGYSTKYWWSSNLSDGGGGAGGWDNDTYHFTTMQDPGGEGVDDDDTTPTSVYKILTIRSIGEDAMIYVDGKSMPVNSGGIVTFTLRVGTYEVSAIGETKTLEQTVQLLDSKLITFDFTDDSLIPGIDVPGIPGFGFLGLFVALGISLIVFKRRRKT